jgi:hypothetical protein
MDLRSSSPGWRDFIWVGSLVVASVGLIQVTCNEDLNMSAFGWGFAAYVVAILLGAYFGFMIIRIAVLGKPFVAS